VILVTVVITVIFVTVVITVILVTVVITVILVRKPLICRKSMTNFIT
jgi:hypothetical protein